MERQRTETGAASGLLPGIERALGAAGATRLEGSGWTRLTLRLAGSRLTVDVVADARYRVPAARRRAELRRRLLHPCRPGRPSPTCCAAGACCGRPRRGTRTPTSSRGARTRPTRDWRL
ncbi:hypothetical protein OG311_14520 [Streptomyces sp. NBC_01343]|uniref:hypothetical protein n=1 Tax=Streptomyces sp. NBC_01343 TaxID=2903832 RepID=UPI002E13EE3F|nr:hypothetical protein OG311_14520 [Streptomyces sp. NBC_01343]